jgi:hypothetical protein
MPDEKPARTASRLDLAFRGLALLGVLELGALAANLALYPNGPGIAGQGLALRLVLGLLLQPSCSWRGRWWSGGCPATPSGSS